MGVKAIPKVRCLGGASRLRRCLATGVLAFLSGLGAAASVCAEPAVSILTAAAYPEGPLWHDGRLYYVEYTAGNVIAWDGTATRVYWHRDGCGPSGLIEFRGGLLVACYDQNALVLLDAGGRESAVIRAPRRAGSMRGPNDLAVDGRGGVYVSASGVYEKTAPITGTIWHLASDGRSLTQLADTIHYPNGLTRSADGNHLLVAEMLAGRILSFEIRADGSLGARSVWARLQDLVPPTANEDAYNGPDGLKLGPDGNYYVAQNGSGRVLVVNGEGALVRTISVPTPFVTNLAFGTDGVVFVTGAFDQWKAPFPGAVYRWAP
jgi:gluconolactonase